MSAGPESLLIELFGHWLLPALLAGVVVTVGWLLITRLRPRRRPDTPKETAMGESQRPSPRRRPRPVDDDRPASPGGW